MEDLIVISNPTLVGEKSEHLINQISQSPGGMPMAEYLFVEGRLQLNDF